MYSIAFGFTPGTIISGAAAAFTVYVNDLQNLGTYMGQGLAIASFAALIGPPTNGVLIDKYGGFSEVTIYSGIMTLVGGLLALFSKVATPQGMLGKV